LKKETVKDYDDIFRPHDPIGRAIYDAFQKEAKKRSQYTSLEWQEKELQAVHEACKKEAEKLGVAPVNIEDVRKADRNAAGHVDYGAKLALRLRDLILNQSRSSSSTQGGRGNSST
jgi:hypothetical protein